MSRYIVKPFEEDEVLATLAELRQRLSRQELPCVDPLEPLSYRANPGVLAPLQPGVPSCPLLSSPFGIRLPAG